MDHYPLLLFHVGLNDAASYNYVPVLLDYKALSKKVKVKVKEGE